MQRISIKFRSTRNTLIGPFNNFVVITNNETKEVSQFRTDGFATAAMVIDDNLIIGHRDGTILCYSLNDKKQLPTTYSSKKRY